MFSIRLITILFFSGGLYLLITGNAKIQIGQSQFDAPRILIRIIAILFIGFSVYLFKHPEIAYNFSQ